MLPDGFVRHAPRPPVPGGEEDRLMPAHIQLNILELHHVWGCLWFVTTRVLLQRQVGPGMLLSVPTDA